VPIYLDDKKLVKRLLAGDEQAFNQFFDENFGRLYRFALARTSHDEEATREIVQATMSQAVRKIHSNLGLILNKDLGKPNYFDVFAELAINISDDTRLSFNGMYADDRIEVVTESDPEELERRNECCIDYDLDEDDDGNVFLDRTVEHWLPIIPAIGVLRWLLQYTG